MSDELPWSHPVAVATLPPGGVTLELVPDQAARIKLAAFAGVIAIPSLSVRLEVRPAGAAGAEVTGELTGMVRQRCVVSLEEFDNPVSVTIEATFADDPAGLDLDPDDEDEPDPVIDGKIDLGALASEFLCLAVDPYPRKSGMAFANPAAAAEDAPAKSPFESLSKLTKGMKK